MMERTFGEKLKLARDRRSIKQYEIAKILYVDRTTVSSWERDRTQPNLKQFLDMCEFMDINPRYFMSEGEKYDNQK